MQQGRYRAGENYGSAVASAISCRSRRWRQSFWPNLLQLLCQSLGGELRWRRHLCAIPGRFARIDWCVKTAEVDFGKRMVSTPKPDAVSERVLGESGGRVVEAGRGCFGMPCFLEPRSVNEQLMHVRPGCQGAHFQAKVQCDKHTSAGPSKTPIRRKQTLRISARSDQALDGRLAWEESE